LNLPAAKEGEGPWGGEERERGEVASRSDQRSVLGQKQMRKRKGGVREGRRLCCTVPFAGNSITGRAVPLGTKKEGERSFKRGGGRKREGEKYTIRKSASRLITPLFRPY